jgi:Pyruvate/2-oxoacid:ferredoxin oxidoreductase gamma subunit
MLGGLFALGVLDLSEDNLFMAMEERWPERLVKVNRKAYRLGHEAVSASLGVPT